MAMTTSNSRTDVHEFFALGLIVLFFATLGLDVYALFTVVH